MCVRFSGDGGDNRSPRCQNSGASLTKYKTDKYSKLDGNPRWKNTGGIGDSAVQFGTIPDLGKGGEGTKGV